MATQKNSNFAAAKKQAALQILNPAGFSKGAGLFYRVTGQQIHGIEFQASSYGRKYYVNVGFHYDFLPSPREVCYGHKTAPVERFAVVDFMFYNRLEDLLLKPSPGSWAYGDNIAPSVVLEQMSQNARDAVEAVTRFGHKWSDPNALIDALTPGVVEEELQAIDAQRELDPDDASALPPTRFQMALGTPYMWLNHFHLLHCLSLIAMRVDRASLAREYLPLAERIVETDAAKETLAGLRRKLS